MPAEFFKKIDLLRILFSYYIQRAGWKALTFAKGSCIPGEFDYFRRLACLGYPLSTLAMSSKLISQLPDRALRTNVEATLPDAHQRVEHQFIIELRRKKPVDGK